MKQNKYFLNTALSVVLGIAILVCILVRTLFPAAIIPRLDLVNIALLSLIALVADHYIAGHAPRCYICIPVFSALAFGLLPFAAGFVSGLEALKIALVGGSTFTALTWLYSTILDRLSTGPTAKLAPLVSAFGLYLAVQCFAGIIL